MRPSPLRLAFDATALLGSPTGIGTFVGEVLPRLATHPDLAVTAFAISWRGRDALTARCADGVRVTTRPMAARPLRLAWQRANVPPLQWWTGGIDVVHGPNFVVPPARRAAELVTVHDLTPVRYPELCSRDTLAYPGLITRALRRGAWVHTPSQFVADEVVEHFQVSPDRVVAIHNGVTACSAGDTDRPTQRLADPDTSEAAGQAPVLGPHAPPGLARALTDPRPFVLALGTVEPRKDLPALVEAFDALARNDPEVRLVVAGPDGWGVAAYTDAVARCAARDRIVRVGWVDDAGRAALLARAAVLAYPSRYEGFGLPPLEAMQAGIPVVATDAGALPEVLGDAALVVSADTLRDDRPAGIAALADALHTALHDDERRARLIAAGHARAARYSWDTTAAALASLYARLAADT